MLCKTYQETAIRFPSMFQVRHQTQQPKYTTATASRKNKDATGTKIKRSKNRTENAEQSRTMNSECTNVGISSMSNSQASSEANKSIEDTIGTNRASKSVERGMDVEAFIRDKEPVVCKEYDSVNTALDSEDMSFADAAQDIVDNENERFSENSERDSENILTNFNMFDDFKATGEIIEAAITKEVADDINSNLVNDKTGERNGDKKPISATIVSDDINKDNSGVCQPDAVKHDLVGTPSVGVRNHKNKNKIDDKIFEMEQRTLKKFKGTMLDNLF